jgi:hypothetical protein
MLNYAAGSEKGYGGLEVETNAFLTLTEDGDKSTTLHPGHFMSWGTSPEYQ